MSIIQPQATDALNSPSHSKLHRVFAADSASSDQAVIVTSNNDVNIATGKKYLINNADVLVQNTRKVAGKALSSDVTISLDDLSDVIVSTPLVDQIVKYNGSAWINGAETTVNGGSGVDYFPTETASDISTYYTLDKTADTTTEQDETVVVNNNRVLIAAYASASSGLGGTQIDGGPWTFDIWGYVSDISLGMSDIEIDILKRTAGGTETLLFTSKASDFAPLTASLALYTPRYVQPAFAINATDRLVYKVYGKTASVVNRTIHFFHNGTTHYSHVNTPLVVRHNDLAGLQGGTGGEYFHLTNTQATEATRSATGSLRGLLSSADWTTFNGKQNAITNPITGTGTINELSYWATASTQGTLPVATYPSLTELSYVKGATSAIQTQLGGKQPTLVSTTNIKSINGVSILGSGDLAVSGMVYPAAGIPVSTGSAWGTSKTNPTGTIVGTTDAQDLTNKTYNGTVIKSINGNTGITGGFLSPGISNLYTENTIIGYSAGNNIAGYYNTLLGSSAGYLMTGSGNIAVGTNAGFYETGSNAFYINNIDQVNTAGDKAYSLLYGRFSGAAGSLIGQQLTINGQLNVNGTVGTFPTLNQNTTGSAAKLTTARTISGVSFDGSANITITPDNLDDTSTTHRFTSAADITKLAGIATSATANAKITGATLDALTDDTGFVTAKAIQDGKNVPHVAPGTSGNVCTSNGTDWISQTPGTMGQRAFSSGTTDPSGGADGDIYFKYV